jgi:hypothetical protein
MRYIRLLSLALLASLTVTCPDGKKFFKVTTGGGAGSCSVFFDSPNVVGGASCTSATGSQLSVASCGTGCVTANATGTCSPVN